jgi:2-dehydro-3-deoxyphosphogluconate aldolase/(4S)-4-hydroxy-2-oxoglutarate aldolase
MKKTAIYTRMAAAGPVAVVRGNSAQEAIDASIALIKGGIVAIEVAYTTPHADEAIRTLSDQYKGQTEVVIGAGTVLDAITARGAIAAGAEFVVSPCFSAETAVMCHRYSIPYLPGCMTVTEIENAIEHGCDVVKLFPGSAFGPSFVKAVKAPLPDVEIMPTGGVSLDNMADWYKAGVWAVGVGGNLLAPLANGDYAGITAMAEKYAAKYREIIAK